MRRHRRFLEFLCPRLIIIGISLAPGCSRKSEASKFIFLAEGLEFSPRVLVYLDVGVHPDMESRPKQIRTQTGRFGLTNPRRGKNPNGGSTRLRTRSPFCFGSGPTVSCWRLRITGMGPPHRRKSGPYAMSGHPIPTAYGTHRTRRLYF